MSEAIKIMEVMPEIDDELVRATLTHEDLNTIRDMQMNYGIDPMPMARRQAALRNSAMFSQYETYAEINVGQVKVVIHYGAPPCSHYFEATYTDIFEHNLLGLFCGIYNAAYLCSPFSMHSPKLQMTSRGMKVVREWVHHLFNGRLMHDFDFELLSQRVYVCLDKQSYDIIRERTTTGVHNPELEFPSKEYIQHLERKKYYLILS